jgi:hypothetical protein
MGTVRQDELPRISSSNNSPQRSAKRRPPFVLAPPTRSTSTSSPSRLRCRTPEVDKSALPNGLARTLLFAPIQRGPREMHDQALLASPDGIEVRFTGKQLESFSNRLARLKRSTLSRMQRAVDCTALSAVPAVFPGDVRTGVRRVADRDDRRRALSDSLANCGSSTIQPIPTT